MQLCEIGERKRCSLISAYYVGGEANCLDSCEGFDLSSCETGLTKGFIKVQAGSFWMGSPEGCPAPGGYLGGCQSELGRDADEKLHYVILSRSFEMAKYKTTQKEFFDVMGYASTAFPACGDDCPADACPWHEALAYANAFSAKRGFPQCFDCSGTGASTRCSLKPIYSTPYDCPGFRIPTEAEWEYAVRAGSTTPFYPSQGNDGGITYTEHIPVDPNADQIGWFGGNSSASYEGAFNCGNVFPGGGMCGPQPIGLKDPNAWGFYDMCGNAWEWVFDVYAAYESSDVSKPLVNPVCASGGNSRVTRSGGWGTVAKKLRSANRASSIPEFKSNAYGIRLVRTLP